MGVRLWASPARPAPRETEVTGGWAGKKLLRAASWFVDDRLVSDRQDLFAYYAGQDEGQRLFRFRHNRLELLRTRELLQRQLPLPPAVVLDVAAAPAYTRPGWRAGATACILSTLSRGMSEPHLSTGT
jgi:hypothetical protein